MTVRQTLRAAFPSVAWFAALQQRMNGETERFKRLGFADSRAIFIVKSDAQLTGDRSFGVVFDAYECTEVRELSPAEAGAFDHDWKLEGAYGAWKEMIENIRAHGAADADHTLGRLSLLKHPFRLYGDDQMRVDLFYRQQSSFQEYIDGAAAVETMFHP